MTSDHVQWMGAFIGKTAIAGLGVLAIPSIAGAQNTLDQALPVRGLCIAAPNPSQVEPFVRFIGEELAPRAVNTLILRVDPIPRAILTGHAKPG